jgi:hypothetical protein
MDQTISALNDLTSDVRSEKFGKSKPWQGADVVITNEIKAFAKDGFYPEPRYVLTPHVRELSWLFEQLRDLFIDLDGYGAWKEEFFGRLGNMARRFNQKSTGAPVTSLLLAVLHEAYAIAEEMQDGEFHFLPVAIGNQIYDDLIESAERDGFLTVAETEKYFQGKGLLS